MLDDPARIRPAHRPVLVVLHQERSSAGRVGQLLVEKGFPLDIRRPVLGDPLPDTLSGHSGAVVFGGPMSANDPDRFVHDEIDWLSVPLKENRPYLGICLGAQMLARHLGAKVRGHDRELVEIGWYPIQPTTHGRLLMKWPKMVYHFHREGFDLPHGATLLATGDVYPNQAIRYGEKAFGIQFHAELTRAMMQRWVVHGASRFSMPNAQAGRDHLEGRMLFDAPLKAWLSDFLDLVFAEEGQSATLRQKTDKEPA
ncbi:MULTISPECIES: glutamine amidotransferase [Rhizobium/Agrobacterium group]|uniref:glutamine amidotransferase n=1 Tax=Rhizobium/Agrobacterium group TaxID=227290 RepID=UPI000B3FC66A|nr:MULTISPECIES: glutamine amidotransferase [Rhizobium/Agrobacterium group]MCF1484238.1 glutamine amidotransferase [Allorhizobium ampelinum]NSZ44130.1 glutamine amidotransferase [Agrobacterium vitis]NTA27878.1 glutamine amidotransferase [Allorhizobium ampelinum]OVE93608.1 GMP synthase [Allorhizobium ampelinum]